MIEKATFGAGCFWKTEDQFLSTQGIIKTSVGYMGGHFPDPSYLDVVARITGHAEVAQVEFDPNQVTYEELLAKFWAMHDPTSLNRQGADRGEQYRSVIFYHNQDQKRLAEQSKWSLLSSGTYPKKIVTEIQPSQAYYLASSDHQKYFAKKRQNVRN